MQWRRAPWLAVVLLAPSMTGCLDMESVLMQVSVGHASTCGVTAAEHVVCWGDDSKEPPAGSFVQVEVGVQLIDFFACALATDNKVSCWGNSAGSRASPPAEELTTIAVGDSVACGLTSANELRCWGDDAASVASDLMARVPAGDAPASLAFGGEDECMLTRDGVALCRRTTDIPPMHFQKLAVGGYITSGHVCGLGKDGTVACWGNDSRGQSTPPEGTFTDIAAGDQFSCALRSNGSIECWGQNSWDAHEPPEGDFVAIAAAVDNGCGLTHDGQVTCWGFDAYGVTDGP